MPFLFGLVLFGLGAYCISRIYDGFRNGEMQVIGRGVAPIFFFRKFEPILFWCATAFNACLATICFGGTAVMLLQGVTRK